MIRVVKPPSPPKLTEGVQQTNENCKAYDLSPGDYQAGTKKFSFLNRVYGHKSVKQTLQNAQHRKCCFCEKDLLDVDTDIEHYRPKGAVRQNTKSTAAKLGYYWLAYSWENLYECCPICNRSNKKEFFPLRDPTKRAVSHHDDLTQEEPLLLDPGGEEDPREHITFRKEQAIGMTVRGETTIRVLGLNRNDLIELRLERLEQIRMLHKIVGISSIREDRKLEEWAVLARQELKKATEPTSPFSAMATDYLSTS